MAIDLTKLDLATARRELVVLCLGGDEPDCIASRVCDLSSALLAATVTRVKFDDAGDHVLDVARAHRVVVVVDTMTGAGAPGDVAVVNLSELVRTFPRAQISSCHGGGIVDQLRTAFGENSIELDREIYLFGIEVSGIDSVGAVNLRLNEIVSKLSVLINRCVSLPVKET